MSLLSNVPKESWCPVLKIKIEIIEAIKKEVSLQFWSRLPKQAMVPTKKEEKEEERRRKKKKEEERRRKKKIEERKKERRIKKKKTKE